MSKTFTLIELLVVVAITAILAACPAWGQAPDQAGEAKKAALDTLLASADTSTPPVVVEKGEPGKDGKDGASGHDGRNGRNGHDGHDGHDGRQGAPGQQGPRGYPGKDADPATLKALMGQLKAQACAGQMEAAEKTRQQLLAVSKQYDGLAERVDGLENGQSDVWGAIEVIRDQTKTIPEVVARLNETRDIAIEGRTLARCGWELSKGQAEANAMGVALRGQGGTVVYSPQVGTPPAEASPATGSPASPQVGQVVPATPTTTAPEMAPNTRKPFRLPWWAYLLPAMLLGIVAAVTSTARTFRGRAGTALVGAITGLLLGGIVWFAWPSLHSKPMPASPVAAPQAAPAQPAPEVAPQLKAPQAPTAAPAPASSAPQGQTGANATAAPTQAAAAAMPATQDPSTDPGATRSVAAVGRNRASGQWGVYDPRVGDFVPPCAGWQPPVGTG